MTITPRTTDELRQIVADTPAIDIRGASTKAPPASADCIVHLGELAGLKDYTPAECVFSAQGGTTLRAINAALAAHGQYMPFDPPLVDAGATIGGTVAAGLSGPGRYRYGGVRDFLIGARVVDGEGRLITSGGKVVKNAAGFLLHHALVGSAGRFGVIVEVTFKVFPAPQASTTLIVRCRGVNEAMIALDTLHRDRFELASIDADAAGTLWVRLSGRAATLPVRAERARRALDATGQRPISIDVLSEADDREFWSRASEFAWAPREGALVKVPVTPALVPIIAGLRRDSTRTRFSSGFSVAWIAWQDELSILSRELAAVGARGMALIGPSAGTRLGVPLHNEFEERVRRVLDPRDKFRAASHQAH
jgi:glycolate dehydrogenase FAD-binding subunit